MSQTLMSYMPQETKGDCQKAIAPIVYQEILQIPELTGDTPTDLLPAVVTGEIPAYGGSVAVLNTCQWTQIDVTYLSGDDCDSCTTPDALVPEVKTLYIRPGGFIQKPLPDGYIVQIQATVVDGFEGAPVVVPAGKIHEVEFNSCFSCCSGAIVAP